MAGSGLGSARIHQGVAVSAQGKLLLEPPSFDPLTHCVPSQMSNLGVLPPGTDQNTIARPVFLS